MTTWTDAAEAPEYVAANYVAIDYVRITFIQPDEAAPAWSNATEAGTAWVDQ